VRSAEIKPPIKIPKPITDNSGRELLAPGKAKDAFDISETEGCACAAASGCVTAGAAGVEATGLCAEFCAALAVATCRIAGTPRDHARKRIAIGVAIASNTRITQIRKFFMAQKVLAS
jgi:hypothetical protein